MSIVRFATICDHCGGRAACRKWYHLNKEKAQAQNRKTALRLRYGITPDDYEAMLVAQGGACAICGGNRSPTKRLAVDHCHATGAIRALLCVKCNAGLGGFSDSPGLLMAAVTYLAAHPQREVA